MTGRNVDRHVGSTAGIRVPGPAPRCDSRFERGDNSVGEFLVVVASLCGMASQVSHLAAPRNGIVPENSLPGLAWRPAGQGRASGPGETSEAARPAEPLPRRTSMRDRSLSVYLYGLCIDLYSSSWANKRSALRAIWKARKTPLPTVKPQSVGPDSTRERSCAARGRRCGIGRGTNPLRGRAH